jgi:DnaJ-class molecular chaperone
LVILPIEKTCPKCGGSGKRNHFNMADPYDDECPRCEGTGKVEKRPKIPLSLGRAFLCCER